MKITAFCPGHITGFFVPKKHHDDPLKSGSLGAGICVDKGAITTVTITEGKKTSNPWSMVNQHRLPRRHLISCLGTGNTQSNQQLNCSCLAVQALGLVLLELFLQQ